MAKQYLVSINLNKNELQSAVVHNLAADPGSPVDGLLYYNTVSKKLRTYNGATWTEYGDAAAAGDVTQSSNSGGAGRLKVSAGANKAITDYATAGIVKSDVNGVASAAVSGTDYSAGTAALATGILKSTTTTGALSIAVAGDFPTLNQNTTGSAATLTTPRNIQGVSFNGSANIDIINGTGFVKATGTTLSYDNSTYLTTSSASSTYAPIASPTFTGTVTIPIGASITLPNFSTSATVSAAGTNQGTATALTSDVNIITTVGSGTGVILPTAAAGKKVVIVNKGANTLNIFPASGAAIDALGANTAITLPVNGVMDFSASSTTQWYSSSNQYISGTFVTGNITGSAGSVANALTVDNSSLQLDSGTTYNGSAVRTISVKAAGITNAMLAGSIDLTTKVTGILPAANGGTANGFTAFSGPATSTKTFTLPNASATILTDNAVVTGAQGGTGVNNSGKTITLGGNFSTSGAFALVLTITAGTNVTLPTTGTLATLTDLSSGTASFTNKTFDANGTGNSISNLETADFAANVIDTDGTLAANSNTRIASQQATKTYVDAVAQGVRWKDSVRAATTAAGTLATSFENGDVIDGVTLATGDRILIKDQSSGSENGIYTVNASGAPTRATDADTGTEVRGMVVPVREGTANADHSFINTNDSAVTLNTTALTFTDFVSANVPSATTTLQGKVELATQAETEAKSDGTRAVTPASLATFTRKVTATIGDGVTTAIAVTDNLGTVDKVCMIRRASDDVVIECDYTFASNTTTFTFNSAPASNAYKVVIIG